MHILVVGAFLSGKPIFQSSFGFPIFSDSLSSKKFLSFTLIWVGFLGIGFEMGRITYCLSLVRIMLETWKLARKYRLIFSFKNYIFSHKDPLNFADVSIFLQKSA